MANSVSASQIDMGEREFIFGAEPL